MQFRNADALDAKAFGLLGADAAALAVLVATHSSLGEVWWLPATGLGLSALLLLAGVKPERA